MITIISYNRLTWGKQGFNETSYLNLLKLQLLNGY